MRKAAVNAAERPQKLRPQHCPGRVPDHRLRRLRRRRPKWYCLDLSQVLCDCGLGRPQGPARPSLRRGERQQATPPASTDATELGRARRGRHPGPLACVRKRDEHHARLPPKVGPRLSGPVTQPANLVAGPRSHQGWAAIPEGTSAAGPRRSISAPRANKCENFPLHLQRRVRRLEGWQMDQGQRSHGVHLDTAGLHSAQSAPRPVSRTLRPGGTGHRKPPRFAPRAPVAGRPP